MNDDIKKELNKIYKLTGIKLSIENEDEVTGEFVEIEEDEEKGE